MDFGIEAGSTDFGDMLAFQIEKELDITGVPVEEWRVSGKAREDKSWWLINGPIFVENWRRYLRDSPYFIALTPEGEPAIELELDGTLGNAPYKGYLDRVLEDPVGNLYVYDLKSGSRSPKAAQLLTYRVILNQIYDGRFTPRWGAYFMVRKGSTTGNHDLASLDNGTTEYQYGVTWQAIQSGIFIPNPVSGWCESCDVKRYCYAVNGDLAEETRPFSRKGKNV